VKILRTLKVGKRYHSGKISTGVKNGFAFINSIEGEQAITHPNTHGANEKITAGKT
jgi:hypothetical protein